MCHLYHWEQEGYETANAVHEQWHSSTLDEDRARRLLHG
jgi:hypothetical protein